MDPKKRERRNTEIMNEMIKNLQENGPLTLTELSKKYRKSKEMGSCLIAFSRLEAEGLIIRKPNGKWKVSNLNLEV